MTPRLWWDVFVMAWTLIGDAHLRLHDPAAWEEERRRLKKWVDDFAAKTRAAMKRWEGVE